MMRLDTSALVMLVAAAACGPAPAPPVPVAPSPPGVLPPERLAAVCAREPCGGPDASVTVYRDGAGEVQRLVRLYGGCSHSPALYFDGQGLLLDTIPETPVMRGSPEAEAAAARTGALVAGFTATDVVRCSDGARRDPPPTR